ncbi:related to Exocyst complex component EXO84 [Saccharomycodes ludwigii]|uniref:Exocyst complex component EXO84 n=1 Tax=Saccharomycodes ludwigii TaxID=36035 RepID=A0A376B5E7_9ASCO|nr:hypothetical protein SCDLUD_000715 [Saccharomycodes ludwigii]KAH3903103.1 hypothetical protein SCDLUD_000715 [Saccharomycodes ludwigii]SSD59908.1 related to Exocyst complex component EXO84 [Saccharomycodes ludwigii]
MKSLKKATHRSNWKKSQKQHESNNYTNSNTTVNANTNNNGLKHTTKKKNNNNELISKPYDQMKVPEINTEQRKKVGSLMQRRLSIHLSKEAAVPNIDLNTAPALPSNIYTNVTGDIDSKNKLGDYSISATSPIVNRQKTSYNPNILRKLLGDKNFQAKNFVSDSLGDATAREIDNFTTSLNQLSNEVSDEIKDNIDKSYKEILVVNKELNTATVELKKLRTNIDELNDVLKDFKKIATKKLATASKLQSTMLPQPTTPKQNMLELEQQQFSSTDMKNRKDRTSVYMLEKIWENELNVLWKHVEGAQKYAPAITGRHILTESSDWFEINVATLKPLYNVHLIVLNDLLLVASRKFVNNGNTDAITTTTSSDIIHNASDEPNLYVIQYGLLRDVKCLPNEKDNRLSVSFGNNKGIFVYQCRKGKEYTRVLSCIRSAKDEIQEFAQHEEENAKKIRDSLLYLQNVTGNTPVVSSSVSPRKSSHGRTPSYGTNPVLNLSPAKKDDFALMQNVSISINSITKSRDTNSGTYQIKQADDMIGNIGIYLSRKNFKDVVRTIDQAMGILTTINKNYKLDDKDEILRNATKVKLDETKQLVIDKLMSNLNNELMDLTVITDGVKYLLFLDVPAYQVLDLFLTNRSNYIKDLGIRVSSTFLNTDLYILEITIIRFQIIKKAVVIFNELFRNSDFNMLSSTLAAWVSDEIDLHFELLEKVLYTEPVITSKFVKSSRRQIDELKTVGMDFVYKLDKFMADNNSKLEAHSINAPQLGVK